jgi:bacterioferritin
VQVGRGTQAAAAGDDPDGQASHFQQAPDMAVETEAVSRLRRGMELMRSVSDVTSANIFEAILADEEGHIDYLETQLGLITQLGEPLYLAQLIEQPAS